MLLPSNRYLFKDASQGISDLSCGPLTPIGHIEQVVNTTYDAIRPLPLVDEKPKPESGESSNGRQHQALKVDGGKSLICHVSVVGEVMRSVVGGVQAGFGIKQ